MSPNYIMFLYGSKFPTTSNYLKAALPPPHILSYQTTSDEPKPAPDTQFSIDA